MAAAQGHSQALLVTYRPLPGHSEMPASRHRESARETAVDGVDLVRVKSQQVPR